MLLFFLSAVISVGFAYEKDITFTVNSGKTDCFFQNVSVDEFIDMDYQVIDSSHGELDISFQFADPMGRVLIAEYKKPENSHRHKALIAGDYRFCFDNSFSTFSHKTVFFDLLIQAENVPEKEYDDKEMELGNAAESYIMRVSDISESLTKVKDHVSAARRLQELLSAHEARDRNLAEEMCNRVLKWSMSQIILMILVGLTQVIFVRSLFEDQNSRKSLKGYMPNFMSQ